MISEEHLKILKKIDNDVTLPDGMLERLSWIIKIMALLRAPNGCPWDKVQDHESLLKNLIEESYEFVDTVRGGSVDDMREELGDLLLQVLFHAEIAQENGHFHLGDVAEELADKLVRRHPHVFGDKHADGQEQALESWNTAKKKEGWKKFSLNEVPKSMPALLRARKVQEKAGKVGFEWQKADGAMEKIDEELAEFKEAVASGDNQHAGEELGDLLFAVVNVARYVKHCPEVSLTQATDKFVRRFGHIEARLAESGRTPYDSTLDEMDGFWNEAKDIERES